MPTSLLGISKKAASEKQYRFANLFGLLTPSMLKGTWRGIRKSAAAGVDRVEAREYEKQLKANVEKLVDRLKRKRYRARLIRRRLIPKGNGKMRPLGIPVVEDKLLQLAVAKILEAIYEEDFLRCSYGYRPKVGAHGAVDKLTVKLQFGRYGWVVEADIKGFFDHLDHEWLLKMLQERIEDRWLLWLIKKWLKAGVLEEGGQVIHPATGTPQGGIISPVLANVYLHYCLDLWFHKVVRKHCRGEACLIRYADDFVCAFEYQEDAERFYRVLGKRLEKFGLEVSQAKTRVIEFNRETEKTSFEFLGFEFRWGRDRAGKAHLKRRTARKKLCSSLSRFAEWCRENRSVRFHELMEQLKLKLRGYYNYYGIKDNSLGLKEFYSEAIQQLFKWLNRRSQRTSFSWAEFRAQLKVFQIPTPRITESRQMRLAAS
jgi:RNA-directed DNA polymerase